MINTILIMLVVLIAYMLLWFVANVVLYYLSIALKKPVIFESFHAASTVFLWLYNTILGFGLLWIGISLLMNRQFLWLIVYLFIGASIIGWFINMIQLPFVFIQAYFVSKLEDFDFKENVETAEILDEKNKVIGVTEGNSAITIRLARYFTIFYLINLLEMIIFPRDIKGYGWGDYLVTPFLQIVGGTLIVGIPYALYHRARYGSFLSQDRRYFLIKVWKVWIIFFAVLTIFGLILKMFNS